LDDINNGEKMFAREIVVDGIAESFLFVLCHRFGDRTGRRIELKRRQFSRPQNRSNVRSKKGQRRRREKRGKTGGKDKRLGLAFELFDVLFEGFDG